MNCTTCGRPIQRDGECLACAIGSTRNVTTLDPGTAIATDMRAYVEQQQRRAMMNAAIPAHLLTGRKSCPVCSHEVGTYNDHAGAQRYEVHSIQGSSGFNGKQCAGGCARLDDPRYEAMRTSEPRPPTLCDGQHAVCAALGGERCYVCWGCKRASEEQRELAARIPLGDDIWRDGTRACASKT